MKDTTQQQVTLKARLFGLWKSHSSPHEIAMGVAIGVFIGITPFYGFHILSALLAAFVIKGVNKIAIFLGMSISIPPTIPIITWAAYEIGRSLLGGAYPPLSWGDFRNFSFDTFVEFFFVLSVGSFILGMTLSVLFYYITLGIFQRKSRSVLRPKAESLSAMLDALAD